MDKPVFILKKVDPMRIKHLGLPDNTRFYRMGVCQIRISYEPKVAGGTVLSHIAVFCRKRDPSCEELQAIREELMPEVRDVHVIKAQMAHNEKLLPHTYHLWEARDF